MLRIKSHSEAGAGLAVEDLRAQNQVAVGDGIVDAEAQLAIAGADGQAIGIDEFALEVDERRDGSGTDTDKHQQRREYYRWKQSKFHNFYLSSTQ